MENKQISVQLDTIPFVIVSKENKGVSKDSKEVKLTYASKENFELFLIALFNPDYILK